MSKKVGSINGQIIDGSYRGVKDTYRDDDNLPERDIMIKQVVTLLALTLLHPFNSSDKICALVLDAERARTSRFLLQNGVLDKNIVILSRNPNVVKNWAPIKSTNPKETNNEIKRVHKVFGDATQFLHQYKNLKDILRNHNLKQHDAMLDHL